MKYASIGTPAASPSRRTDDGDARGGFTLVEALVALSLLLVFAVAWSPVLSHARRLLARGDGEIRAELLLRSLLTADFDAADPQNSLREGERDRYHWRVAVEPFEASSLSESNNDGSKPDGSAPAKGLSLYKVSARVSWGNGAAIAAESLRLGRTASD
jgi:prepilin-type N-terminal cleavage/methylation domain-containing protein